MSTPTIQGYPCPACGKTYQRKNHLSRHKATHENTSGYRCPGCRKIFSRSDVWRKHCTKCPQRADDRHLPHLTRGRKPEACEQCVRSKVACDKREPCGRCRTRHLDCSYGRRQNDTQASGTSALSPSSKQRLDGHRSRSGATFLLHLTDPMAAHMVESFTDDDPSDMSNDFAASLSTEQVLLQEDDNFLRSLGGFIFEMVQVEMNYTDTPVHLKRASDPVSPIFRPEALMTLQAKSESAVRDLHTLHQSLSTRDASYSETFDVATAEEVFSPESIIHFAATYFHLSHHHVPIVHRPSFGSQSTTPVLLLAVALAGSLRSLPRDDALSMRGFARLIEEYTFLRLENIASTQEASGSMLGASEHLEMLQAAVLVNNVQFMANNVSTRRRIRTRRLPALVSWVRRLGLSAIRHSPTTDNIRYVQEESCIRIAHWTAMADWHQSVMFHMPPLMTISEMTGDMPDAAGAWDSDDPSGSRAGDEQLEASVHDLRSIRGCIHALMQDQLVENELAALRCMPVSNLYLIILGLSSAIISADLMSTISMSASSLERALVRWQDIWKFAGNAKRDALTTSGIEWYSDGQCWAARKILGALGSGHALHPYLDRVGHDTLVEFHSFLVQT